MKIEELNGDLFNAPEEFYLAHCISRDFALGAGIAVKFESKFHLKKQLMVASDSEKNSGCVLTGRVFNLITKEKYYEKPSYRSMLLSLIRMKNLCEKHGIENIAMPMIGCGLDRLEWGNVKQLIQDTFAETNVNIVVYKLNNRRGLK